MYTIRECKAVWSIKDARCRAYISFCNLVFRNAMSNDCIDKEKLRQMKKGNILITVALPIMLIVVAIAVSI